MADRRSPAIFAQIFSLLARYNSKDHRDMALEMWRAMDEYDFSPCELECDEQLETLGLARKRIDPDHPTDGVSWHYGPEGEDRS